MTLPADKSFRMKMRDVENAFKYRRIPYPKRSVELIALLAISCTFFLFMHTNKLNSRLKEMEVKLQPSEFSALGLTGDNHISGRDAAKHDINTLHGTYQYLKSTGQRRPRKGGSNDESEVDGDDEGDDTRRRSSWHRKRENHRHHSRTQPEQQHLHKPHNQQNSAGPGHHHQQAHGHGHGHDHGHDHGHGHGHGDSHSHNPNHKHRVSDEGDSQSEFGEDGDLEDNDSDGSNALKDEMDDDDYAKRLDVLNNTKRAEIDMVFFNRVPKVGSQSLMQLMSRLSQVNGFQSWRDTPKAHETILVGPSKQRELATQLVAHQRPHIYSQHIAYLNFTRFHMPRPIYINLVRDPIERVISWHYYFRAAWYYKDMQAKLGDAAPKTPPKEFMEMDLDTCVRTNDINCQFIQNEAKNTVGDHRRQTLFFCGQNHKTCMPFNTQKAMQKAKRTVEEDYAVVGTWEDTNITLTVLEHYIPKYFRNAKVAYYLGKDQLSKVNKNKVKGTVSDETRKILRQNFTMEIEFYEFCKQRLYLQYAAINGGDKIDDDDYLMIPEQNEGDEDY